MKLVEKIKGMSLKRLLKPGRTLYQQVITGGFWISALRITDKGFGFVRIVILARLLTPNDFGLMGIGLLTISILNTFSQTGFQTALIQKKGGIANYLNSVWTINLIRGIGLFVLLFFISPYVAIFFKSPGASTVIRVIGVSIFLEAFTNIGVVYFSKELEFNKQFIFQLSGTAADFIVTVSAALILRNVWALVYGLLVGNAVRCIVSYLVHSYRPKLNLNLEQFKELLGFGKWVFGSTILVFLLTQGDDIFLGKVLGVTALGLYQMAFRSSNMIAVEMASVILDVAFPAYSKLQDDLSKLRDGFLKTLQFSLVLFMPLTMGVFVLAPEFTQIFLGEKWMPMVSAMRFLAFWGTLRAIGASTGILFYSVGRPDILTKLHLAKLLVLAALIYPFTIRWGMVGTSLALVGTGALIDPFNLYLSGKIVKCSGFAFLKIFIIPTIGVVIMVLGMNIAGAFFAAKPQFLSFFVVLTTGLFTYVGAMLILDRIIRYGLIEVARKIVIRH